MKDLHPIISENLTLLRKGSALTQAQLAERLGYSDKAVSRWEKGDTVPDINVLYELCDFYGITIDNLLEKGGSAEKKQVKSRHSLQYSIITCLLGVTVVWLIAIVLFVYLNTKSGQNFWQAFIWAIPASCIVIMYLDRRNFKNDSILFSSITVFIWSLLTSIYLHFLSYNLWLIYIVGIPVQTIYILWIVAKKYK